jgi:hypothetical protein
MPKLPDRWAVGEARYSGGGFVPRVPSARLIPRGAGLKAIGQGVEEFGRGLSAMFRRMEAEAKKQNAERSQTERLYATAQMQRALSDLYEQTLASNDPINAVNNYRAGAQKIIEDASQYINDPRLRENFILRSQIHSESGAAQISRHSLTLAHQQGVATDLDALEKLVGAAAKDRANARGYINQIDQLTEEMRTKYGMSPLEADRLRKKYSNDLAKEWMYQDIDKDPQKFLDRAKKWIDSGVPEDSDVPDTSEVPKPDVLKPPAEIPETTTPVPTGDEGDEGDTEGALDLQGTTRVASLDPFIGMGGGPSRADITTDASSAASRFDIGGSHSLAEQRQTAFANELKDPQIQAQLAALVEAEVGKESPDGKLGFIETVMNRALARGYSLARTIAPGKYWDPRTNVKLQDAAYMARYGRPEDVRDPIALALQGSNLTNFATGNESAGTHSGGATVTVDLGPGHERYVRENDDQRWWSRMLSYAKVPSRYDEGGGFDQPGTAGVGFGGAANPVRMRSDDLKFLEQRGGHNLGVDAPQFSPEMAARLRAAGEVYESETGRRAVFGELSRGYDPKTGEPVQAKYYREFLAGGGLAARPGHSRHERGLAADIPAGPFLNWMHQNGERFGIVFRLGDKDPVHAELAPDTRRVALPIESGQQGPVRIASLEWPGSMLQAPLGTSTASFTVPTRRRTILDQAPQRVAQAGPTTQVPQGSRALDAAKAELKLTPQEEHAYEHHLRNLNMGGVRQPNGQVSTFLDTTVTFGNRTYILPTVWDNKIVSEDEAIRRARADGLDKWPSYPSEQAAEKRYNQLHGYMERDTANRQRGSATTDPAATRQEAYVRAIEDGRRGVYRDPTSARTLVGRQVAQNINSRTANSAENTSPTRSGYPPGDWKGMTQYGNLNLDKRPVVRMPDGNIATTRPMSFALDGKHVVLPTISKDGRVLSPQQALEEYRTTHEYLGVFDSSEHANAYIDAVNTAQQNRYSTNPDPRHEAPREPINSDNVPIPKPRSKGDAGYDPLLETSRQQDIIAGIKRAQYLIAHQYDVPANISRRNWLSLNNMISSGEIDINHFKPIEDAYLASLNGHKENGISKGDYDDLKKRVDDTSKAQTAAWNREFATFDKNVLRPRIRVDETEIATREAMQDPAKYPLASVAAKAAAESGLSPPKYPVPPEVREDAERRYYQALHDIERERQTILANQGNPLILLQPGTIEHPNPWYLDNKTEGGVSPIDVYAKPNLMKQLQQGLIPKPPQLDPEYRGTPKGIGPQYRMPNESFEGFKQRQRRESMQPYDVNALPGSQEWWLENPWAKQHLQYLEGPDARTRTEETPGTLMPGTSAAPGGAWPRPRPGTTLQPERDPTALERINPFAPPIDTKAVKPDLAYPEQEAPRTEVPATKQQADIYPLPDEGTA